MPLPSKEEWRRIREAVRWVEARRGILDQPARRATIATVSPQVQIVRITSVVTVSGRYPGKVLRHDASTSTYTDLDDVWVIGANGGPLSLGRYPARRSGPAGTPERPVFLADDNCCLESVQTIAPSTSQDNLAI